MPPAPLRFVAVIAFEGARRLAGAAGPGRAVDVPHQRADCDVHGPHPGQIVGIAGDAVEALVGDRIGETVAAGKAGVRQVGEGAVAVDGYRAVPALRKAFQGERVAEKFLIVAEQIADDGNRRGAAGVGAARVDDQLGVADRGVEIIERQRRHVDLAGDQGQMIERLGERHTGRIGGAGVGDDDARCEGIGGIGHPVAVDIGRQHGGLHRRQCRRREEPRKIAERGGDKRRTRLDRAGRSVENPASPEIGAADRVGRRRDVGPGEARQIGDELLARRAARDIAALEQEVAARRERCANRRKVGGMFGEIAVGDQGRAALDLVGPAVPDDRYRGDAAEVRVKPPQVLTEQHEVGWERPQATEHLDLPLPVILPLPECAKGRACRTHFSSIATSARSLRSSTRPPYWAGRAGWQRLQRCRLVVLGAAAVAIDALRETADDSRNARLG